MYRRNGVISRSFNSPHGVTINHVKGNGVAKGKGVKRKFSWHGGRVRNAFSEGVLTHRPVVLKEGYLNKPSFFRFGGRKRRWCVLRTYTQTEASLDLYLDETKSRYKGSISLDREANPLLIVKNMEKKRKTTRHCFLSLKVSKTTYQFATDSFRELKEWCALIRQAMDNGNTFSGKLTEPNNIEDGMVNVKFNSNCISLLCPIKEMPLKTWRLDHITSFGQSGGILTFECCSTCSDPSASRCAINIVQEKPTTILNIMERAIRSNPNTSEIHYERSILGDIYHCGHDCTQPRLIHGVSDPSLFRSTSASPQKGFFITADVHRDIFGIPPSCTLDSNDSGLPGTPQAEEAMSEASSIPSPTGSNKSNPSFKPRERGSPYRSPKHVCNGHQGVFKARSMSDSRPSPQAGDALQYYARRQSDEPPHSHHYFNDEPQKTSGSEVRASPHHPRLQYAMISHEPPKLIKREDPDSVPYADLKIQQQQGGSPVLARYSRLRPLDENEDEQIYDEPCDLMDSPFSPTPPRKESGLSLRPEILRKTSVQSTGSYYAPGSDLHDRTEDFQELPPPVPPHQRVSAKHQPRITLNGMHVEKPKSVRRRLQSSSDVLEGSSARQCNSLEGLRNRGSMDNLEQLGRNRSNSVAVGDSGFSDRQLKGSLDLLARLHEEEEKLTKVLNASKWKPNEEMLEARERYDRLGELNRPYQFTLSDLEFDDPDQDMILETTSNLADYHSHVYSAPNHVDKVLTKVASNTVRGYAYKINIPVANTQYDVPRRAANAPVPDLANVRADAPPKPVRYTSSENLHFFN